MFFTNCKGQDGLIRCINNYYLMLVNIPLCYVDLVTYDIVMYILENW